MDVLLLTAVVVSLTVSALASGKLKLASRSGQKGSMANQGKAQAIVSGGPGRGRQSRRRGDSASPRRPPAARPGAPPSLPGTGRVVGAPRPRGAGAARAASCRQHRAARRPQPSRKFVRPGPAASSAPAGLRLHGGGGGGGPALRGAGATPAVRPRERTPGARPAGMALGPQAPSASAGPLAQAGGPSEETLAEPPLLRPGRAWSVSRVTGALTGAEGPSCLRDPGHREAAWPRTGLESRGRRKPPGTTSGCEKQSEPCDLCPQRKDAHLGMMKRPACHQGSLAEFHAATQEEQQPEGSASAASCLLRPEPLPGGL